MSYLDLEVGARALTEDVKTLESLSEERKGYFTWESLATLFTERTGKRVCYKTVYNSCIETLERCWDVKTAVTKCTSDANGTNNYKLPHGIKREEPVSDDVSLDLDDTDDPDPVARTLDYEGLHASLLPSSLPR